MLRTLLALVLVTPLFAQSPQAFFDRAVRDFGEGRIDESVKGFDRVAAMVPDAAPQFWQRGIALYYAGRFDDCRDQFVAHRRVNPNDVENAAWHFLCVARAGSAGEARDALLPVGPDQRAPMVEVYEMLRGALTPEDVLNAAGDRTLAQFFAHLYVGLYFESIGNDEGALEHIRAAALERYASGGYMHTVARVHLRILEPNL